MTNDAGWSEYYNSTSQDNAWGEKADDAWKRLHELWQPNASRSEVLVDLGCGDGRNAFPWLEIGIQVVAVDGASNALEKIAKQCRTRGLAHPTLVVADMRDVPLLTGQAGAIQCFNAVFQVQDVERVFAEMARLVRIGGWVAFNVLTPDDSTYGEGQEIGPKTFYFNETTFRFLSRDDVDRLLPQCLRVEEVRHERWLDPPHLPFRPYEHEHDGLYYFCERIR